MSKSRLKSHEKVFASRPLTAIPGATFIISRDQHLITHAVHSASSQQPPLLPIADLSLDKHSLGLISVVNHQVEASDEDWQGLIHSAVSSLDQHQRFGGGHSWSALHDSIERISSNLSPQSLASLIRQLSMLKRSFDNQQGFPRKGVRWQNLAVRLCEILETQGTGGSGFEPFELASICLSLPRLAPPRTSRLSKALITASYAALDMPSTESRLQGGQVASMACALADNQQHSEVNDSSLLHDRLVASIAAQAHNMSPHELSTALSSIARLGIRPDLTWSSVILPLVASGLPSLRPSQIARTAWSVTRMGMIQDREAFAQWQPSLISSSEALIQRMTGHELSLLLWSLAKLSPLSDGGPAIPPSWTRVLFSRTALMAHQSDLHSLSMILWAVTSLDLKPPIRWTETLSEAASLLFGRKGSRIGQSLSITAWSVAKLHHSPGIRWMQLLVDALMDNGGSLTSQDLANASWAIAKSGHRLSLKESTTLTDLFVASAKRELARAAAVGALVEERQEAKKDQLSHLPPSPPLRPSLPSEAALTRMLSSSRKGSKSREMQERAATSVVSHLVTFLNALAKSGSLPPFSTSTNSPMQLILTLLHQILPSASPQAIPAAATTIYFTASSCHKELLSSLPQVLPQGLRGPVPLPPIFRELIGQILLLSARSMNQIPPHGLVQLLWSLSKMSCPDPGPKWTLRLESSLIPHLNPSREYSLPSLPSSGIAIALWSLARWGSSGHPSGPMERYPSLLSALVMGAALTAPRASPQDLSMTLWSLSHLHIRPGNAAWWSSVLMATETKLLAVMRSKNISADRAASIRSQHDEISSFITCLWAIGRLKVRPPSSWASSASAAVSASCSVMDARELSLCLSGLASSLRSPFSEGSEEKEAIGARVREILMASGRCQEVDGQGSSLDGASLSTLLWSAAKLGLPMGRSAREAALSCARRLVLSLAGRGGEKEGRRLVATIWALDKIGCSPSRSWLEQVEILSELSWMSLVSSPSLKHVLNAAIESMRRRSSSLD